MVQALHKILYQRCNKIFSKTAVRISKAKDFEAFHATTHKSNKIISKAELAKKLPDKIEINVEVQLTPLQIEVYQTMLLDMKLDTFVP